MNQMGRENLIFTLSGIRGIARKDLDFVTVKKISLAYGLWLSCEDKRVIIGKDTRPSGNEIEKAVIEGLSEADKQVINLGICPAPIIIYTKNKKKIPGAIIITGSHNPPEWNGLKLLSERNFLDKRDLEQISHIISAKNLDSYSSKTLKNHKSVESVNAISEYIKDLHEFIDYRRIKRKNNLRVVIDTGAGAGQYATPNLLEGLGCEVKVLNNELLVNDTFPREIEPIEENLRDLRMEVWQGNYDIGFAHDSDADRLAIIGENGVCYPEDIGLALITEYYLKNRTLEEELFVVTNLASSLRFEAIAEKYNAKVIRTPVGEKYLIDRIDSLISKRDLKSKKPLVFGGEGSCGGFIFPYFNKTRDGLFAAAKIIEILVNTESKISDLVSSLPRFYSYREGINFGNKSINLIIELVKKELIEEGEEVNQIDLDLRFGKGKEWFILIHPSNTEPIIRVISEAKRESLARVYCEATAELIKLVISRM
jgi:phosphomannomutase